MKKYLSVFIGLTLLFSFNYTHTLQTKYQSLISLAVAAVGGIIGYQCNKNISGTRLVESKHNTVVRWLFKKINAERHPERAAMLYRSLYALLAAIASGGVAYGITYLFTPWGLSWLAGLYVGNKLLEPITKGDPPKNLEDVEKKFPNIMMQKEYPHVEILLKLLNSGRSLFTAKKWLEQAADDADKNNPKERILAENCTKREKELEKPVKNIVAAKKIVMVSPQYKDEKKLMFKEQKNILKKMENEIKWSKENRKCRKELVGYNPHKYTESRQGYDNDDNLHGPPPSTNDFLNVSQPPPGGTPPQ